MNVAPEIEELNNRVIALVDSGMSRKAALRQIIDDVENKIKTIDGHMQAHPFPLEHQFADGIYLRTIHSPAGTLVVGMKHNFSHFCIITQGDVSVLTDEGAVRFQAPYIFRSPAGSKRIVFHHTDTIWSTVHATKLTDVDAIEKKIIQSAIPTLEAA